MDHGYRRWPGGVTNGQGARWRVLLALALLAFLLFFAASAERSSASAQRAQVATAPASTSPPLISGLAQAGQALTAGNGTWTGTPPLSFAYQWQRCDATGANCPIAGATAQTHTLASPDVRSTIRLAVTGTNAAGSATATSAATPLVVDTYRNTVLADAPLAYWRLDEPSGATSAADASGHGLDSTYLNGVGLGVPGALASDPDTAASFDGVDDRLNRAIVTTQVANVTLEACINHRGLPGNPLLVYNGSGLYSLRARHYDPINGRFLQTDPLPPVLTDPNVASYVYARNRPTTLTDPSGLGAITAQTPRLAPAAATLSRTLQATTAGGRSPFAVGGNPWLGAHIERWFSPMTSRRSGSTVAPHRALGSG